jgi:uncharacterized protein
MAEARELLEAIESGDEARVRALVEQEPGLAAARDANDVPAPILALYHGQASAAEILAAAKGDLDVFEAAALGRVDRLREVLDGDRALARAWTKDGFTALHYAAFFDGSAAARLLLECGADATAVALHKQLRVQPLHSAAASGEVETVRALLDAGADPNVAQSGGFTALHAAGQAGDEALAELLLERGADRSLATDEDKTAADLAVEAGHQDLAARLENS